MKFSLFGIGIAAISYLLSLISNMVLLTDAGPVICSEYVLLAVALVPFRNDNNDDSVSVLLACLVEFVCYISR